MSAEDLTPHVRTNAHPVILNSRTNFGIQNVILAVARDLADQPGNNLMWAYELLFATQVLRMAYDSPRIGGGIDPNVATGLPGLESGIRECAPLAYLMTGWGDETDLDGVPLDSDGHHEYVEGKGDVFWFYDMTHDEIQDAIVHAEAVALRVIHLYEANGKGL